MSDVSLVRAKEGACRHVLLLVGESLQRRFVSGAQLSAGKGTVTRGPWGRGRTLSSPRVMGTRDPDNGSSGLKIL